MKILLILSLLVSQSVFAMDVNEIVKQTHLNSYYQADDGRAQMLMKVYSKGNNKPIKKLFYMLRFDIADGGEQMFYTYFLKPTDIKRTTFLVHKKVKEDDFRRLYIPASDKVLAIAGSRKQDPFMGSDFSYEDVSGRHYSKDNHKLLGVEKFNGVEVYKTQSTPKVKEDKIAIITAWISKADLIPKKVEYTNHKGEIFKRFETANVKVIDGIKTVTKATMSSPLEGTRTEMLLNAKKTKYNVGLKKSIFSERSLKNPPMNFLK
jgi:outer membrane lipoprotein-sorting protein